MKTNSSTTHTSRPASSALNSVRHIRGQGLTEYIIIVSIVAIASISAASFFGDTVKASFVAMGSKLTGQNDYDMEADTEDALDRATEAVTEETDLGNYRD